MLGYAGEANAFVGMPSSDNFCHLVRGRKGHMYRRIGAWVYAQRRRILALAQGALPLRGGFEPYSDWLFLIPWLSLGENMKGGTRISKCATDTRKEKTIASASFCVCCRWTD